MVISGPWWKEMTSPDLEELLPQPSMACIPVQEILEPGLRETGSMILLTACLPPPRILMGCIPQGVMELQQIRISSIIISFIILTVPAHNTECIIPVLITPGIIITAFYWMARQR